MFTTRRIRPPRRWLPRRRLAAAAALGTALVLTATACSGAGSLSGGGDDAITIAMISNSQMTDAQKLSKEFEQQTGTRLKFVTLSENEARAKITASVSTGGGEFDVVMISNYETKMWAENGWLVNLSPYMAADPSYAPDDIIKTVREALSYKGSMYSTPFYGESSLLMYNKEMFAKAGVSLPAKPTWQEVGAVAAKLKTERVAGICLRGKPGWGEVLAPLDTVINAFGGRWFDENWNAQLTSPEVRKAVQFYVDTVRKYGEPGAAAAGYQECGNQMTQRQAAMWYDSSAAVSTLEASDSPVAGKIGYLPAPRDLKDDNGWLYAWSLGIPTSSKHRDSAWAFINWMTNRRYIQNVAAKLGPAHVPPGSRYSTYQLQAYKAVSQAFAAPTLAAMNGADQLNPSLKKVPYTGIQFVGIPEFQDLGTRVSQQISAAIAGQISVDDALAQSQRYAEVVGKTYQNER